MHFHEDRGEIFTYCCLFIVHVFLNTAETRKSCMLSRDACPVELTPKIRFELVSQLANRLQVNSEVHQLKRRIN
jgi:hypothetical protein